MVASGYVKFKNPNEKKESHKETEVSDIFTKFDFHNFLAMFYLNMAQKI